MRITKNIYLIVSFVFVGFNTFSQTSLIKVLNLKTEYKINPVVEAQNPRLSWELQSSERNQFQTAYQIIVSSSLKLAHTDKGDIWDSGKINGNETNQIEYNGGQLKAREICFWRVKVWDKTGTVSDYSNIASWEMGLLNKSNWKAQWIGNDLTALGKGKIYHLPPAPYFRKQVTLKGEIKKARLYVTSLGLYEFYINGQRVGKDYFTPGWTDYNKRVYYQVYDVTAKLKKGKNAFGSMVSEGWYAGYLGYALLVQNPVVKSFYGKVPLLKAQIEIEYTNGEKEIIATDDSWKSNHGAMVEADILNGETYDARLEFKNWAKPGFKDAEWKNAQIYPDKINRVLQVYPGDPVQVFTELKAKSVMERPGGKYIFDLGQNFAGNVRLKIKGLAGDKIIMKYGEVLFPNGDLMTQNLRMARATDTYILRGDPNGEIYMPRFTYHGFQYVEVTGFKEKPSLDAITGIVLTSSTPEVGSFTTDNAMINQLYHNITWTQRSNYFDIPTDCPQRDERLGWTGDAQAYIKSATFNTDISAFFTKWLVDLNDAQRADDTYPIYAPAPNLRVTDTYSPGWSEAGIICPYTIYKTYGDTRVIQKFWPNMQAYLKFLEHKSKGEYVFKEASFEDINPKGGFGDWLSVGKKTPPDMLATMYYAYVSSMMAEMAKAIGKKEDAEKYELIFSKIKQAFLNHYADKDGKFKTNAAAYGDGKGYVDGEMGFEGSTQTAYANAIYMDLLNPTLEEKAGKRLVNLIENNGGKLSTGFLGVKPLLPALSETGHSEEAYKLLLSTTYPSWGFEVINGANTIWERWNSYIKGKGFENNAGMNSFNHYAFGSINEWFFANAAGIKVKEAGYRTFIIKPEIAKEGIGMVKASYHSICGKIISSWRKEGDQINLQIVVPVNTKASIFIPTFQPSQVMENGNLIKNQKDIKWVDFRNGYLNVELGSGIYNFQTTLKK
jgi:alpha-L-rhamnosidase